MRLDSKTRPQNYYRRPISMHPLRLLLLRRRPPPLINARLLVEWVGRNAVVESLFRCIMIHTHTHTYTHTRAFIPGLELLSGNDH